MNTRSRRLFLKTTTAAACAVSAIPLMYSCAAAVPEPSAAKLPRWRGFNLLEKFIKRRDGNPGFRGTDFEIMQEWGFDFARLPMSYHCWSEPDPARWLTGMPGPLSST